MGLLIGMVWMAGPIFSADLSHMDQLEVHYREGYRYEQFRLYGAAIQHYNAVVDQFVKEVEDGVTDVVIQDILPVSLSAAFRLSIVTDKNYAYNMHKLIDQIHGYQATEDRINHIIQTIVQLNLSERAKIPKEYYAMLFFARAYNKIGWGYRLLHGVSWKNYIVYPPQDVIGMFNYAVSDLKQYLLFRNVPYERFESGLRHRWDVAHPIYEAMLSQVVTDISEADPEGGFMKTLRLTHFEDDGFALSKIVSKRAFFQAFRVVDEYYSDQTQATLDYSRRFLTIDEVLDRKNRGLFQLAHQLVSDIGLRK